MLRMSCKEFDNTFELYFYYLSEKNDKIINTIRVVKFKCSGNAYVCSMTVNLEDLEEWKIEMYELLFNIELLDFIKNLDIEFLKKTCLTCILKKECDKKLFFKDLFKETIELLKNIQGGTYEG